MNGTKARMFDLSRCAPAGGFGTLDEMFERLTGQLGLATSPELFSMSWLYHPLMAARPHCRRALNCKQTSAPTVACDDIDAVFRGFALTSWAGSNGWTRSA